MHRVSDIAVFRVVVEQGSFTAAAEALELTKGAVSKYVNRLERRLGVRLLNRTTRRLSLTMELLLDNRFVDLVEERFDVAVRISAPKDSSLVMRRLLDIPTLTCASPAYLERHGRPETPKDLDRHVCLIYTLAPRPHEWTFIDADGSHYGVSVNGSFHTNDDHAQREAALAGIGIVHMPGLYIQEEIDRGDLVQLWPDGRSPYATLAVVYPSRRELPAKVRAFVDFMAECCRSP